MSDLAAFVSTVVAFAVAVTAHVTILAGLAARPPRWRAVLALVFFPLAPYWAVREKMWVRAATWVVGLAAYSAARLLQRG